MQCMGRALLQATADAFPATRDHTPWSEGIKHTASAPSYQRPMHHAAVAGAIVFITASVTQQQPFRVGLAQPLGLYASSYQGFVATHEHLHTLEYTDHALLRPGLSCTVPSRIPLACT
jgi:hypothetical protein